MSKRALTREAKLKLIAGVAGVSAAVFAIVGIAHAEGLWINTTDSMPIGLWLETPAHAARAGDVVLVCLPDTKAVRIGQSRGYIAPGPCPTGQETVLKPVVAGPGDEIDVSPQGVTVNGKPVRNSAQLTQDSQGRQMPAYPAGHYPVAPGELWLVSAHNPRSFDSRYFGPIRAATVRSTVRPLWVTE